MSYRAFRTSLSMVLLLLSVHKLAHAQPHREIVVLHTNDMHAHVLGVREDDTMCSVLDMYTPACFGGFDRIAAEVAHQRSMHKDALLLDAGDQFQGSLFHTLYKGMASVRFMTQIKVDAMAVGNHEFDDGPDALSRFVDSATFPILSANIDVSKSPALKGKIKPYAIIQRQGLRIGLVGYTTEDTVYLSSPGAQVKFLPIIPSLKKAVAELKKAHVDVIIALSHSGLNRDIEIAKSVSGIAAIICGHSNSLLSNTAKNADGPSPLVVLSPIKQPVLLVGAYAYGKFLGKLKFSFDEHGVPKTWDADPILLDHKKSRDPIITAQMVELYQPIKAVEAKHIGVVAVDLEGQSCRFEECVFGNLVADAMLDAGRPVGARLALMNGGGIRASIPKGRVSLAQLRDVMPFDKTVVFLKLRGSVIRHIIEHGVSFAEDKNNDNTGRFLQVAGLHYRFNSKAPRGKRVHDIFVVDTATKTRVPLEMNRLYPVVTNSYLANGGDNYTHFAEATERWNVDIELKELLATFLARASHTPKREGRISNLALIEQPHLQNISVY